MIFEHSHHHAAFHAEAEASEVVVSPEMVYTVPDLRPLRVGAQRLL